MISVIRTFEQRLKSPVSNKLLSWFRILAYGLMVIEVVRLKSTGFINYLFIESQTRFPYEFLPIAVRFNETQVDLLIGIITLSGVLCSVGLLYKYSRWVFLISFCYLFFQDKMLWNNHWYLFVLLAIIGCVIDLSKNYSIDTLINPRIRSTICPRWFYYLLVFQIGLVYFYGGIAKINPDWLFRGEPIGTFLEQRQHYALLGSFFSLPWAKFFFAYSGMFYDLVISFLLLSRKTFKVAVFLTVIFNGLNSIIFHIGVFPYFMLVSNLIFAHVLLPDSVVHQREKEHFSKMVSPSKLLRGFVVVYIVLQGLLPLRQFLYSGNPSWIGVCERFSWRMMIQTKETKEMAFYVYFNEDERKEEVDIFITENQKTGLVAFPETIGQFSKGMREHIESQGYTNFQIRADIIVNHNGGQFQYLVDRNYDLSRAERKIYEVPAYIIPQQD